MRNCCNCYCNCCCNNYSRYRNCCGYGYGFNNAWFLLPFLFFL
ncbi:hypothetical protein [Clostridium taeniosporum]|nr:hypothetical protein [Clostridium taeniosporum]